MNIVCVICSDLLVQADDIVYTRCGHVFHLHCLTQWIERSKTCPQCREKVTESKIHRLYFNFSSNEVVESASSSLQERIDSLKFQILLKEKDIKYYTSKNVTLEKQNAGLRKEVRKVESELNQKNSAIHALKEQIKYFKEQGAECEKLKRELAQLKQKMEELKPIQVLLHSPAEDVDEMVNETRDADTLISYISVMKQELLAILNRCKQLRITIRRLQEELTKVSTERDSLQEEHFKKVQLEEDLMFSESKNMSLQKRIAELEEMLGFKESSVTTTEVQKTNKKDIVSSENTNMKLLKKQSNSKEKSQKNSVLNKRRKEKAQSSKQVPSNNTIDSDAETSTFQIESGEVIITDESFLRCSLSDDSLIAPKRARVSTDNDNSDSSSITEHDIKHKSSLLSKLKKKRENAPTIKKEKHSHKNRGRGNGEFVDLT